MGPGLNHVGWTWAHLVFFLIGPWARHYGPLWPERCVQVTTERNKEEEKEEEEEEEEEEGGKEGKGKKEGPARPESRKPKPGDTAGDSGGGDGGGGHRKPPTHASRSMKTEDEMKKKKREKGRKESRQGRRPEVRSPRLLEGTPASAAVAVATGNPHAAFLFRENRGGQNKKKRRRRGGRRGRESDPAGEPFPAGRTNFHSQPGRSSPAGRGPKARIQSAVAVDGRPKNPSFYLPPTPKKRLNRFEFKGGRLTLLR